MREDVTKKDEEEIDLLHALKTAFSNDGDVDNFLSRAAEEIRQIEATIIETCAKNRLRIDDNLYSLLESRDAISEQTNELDKSSQTASEITARVTSAQNDLAHKTTMRRNLDAALKVAACTRKLTRMYARIEDTIDARRIYTAFRMLKLLEEETRTIRPDTILRELLPDTRRLRVRLTMQTRRALQQWLVGIRPFETPAGAYALHHAAAQAVSHQTMLDSPRGALGEPFALLPLLPPAPPRARGAARPWMPLLTTSQTPVRKRPAWRGHPFPFAAGFPRDVSANGPEIGGRERRASAMVLPEDGVDVPTLYLRPLLQVLHVCEGLHLLAEMRTEYRKERLLHLQNVLHGVDDEVTEGEGERTVGNGQLEEERVGAVDHDGMVRGGGREGDGEESGDQASNNRRRLLSRAEQIETLVFKVVGFFVVERTVQLHASFSMVAREVVDGEWWSLAYAKLLAVFKEHEENGLESANDKAIVRDIEENLERFAEVNGLIK